MIYILNKPKSKNWKNGVSHSVYFCIMRRQWYDGIDNLKCIWLNVKRNLEIVLFSHIFGNM